MCRQWYSNHLFYCVYQKIINLSIYILLSYKNKFIAIPNNINPPYQAIVFNDWDRCIQNFQFCHSISQFVKKFLI